MASSQIEIASSSPFGPVLKEHNRRERCSRKINVRAAASATQVAFQKNLNELVRDHFHTCISVSSGSSSDENSQNHVNNINNNFNHHRRQHLRCLTNHQDDNHNRVDESSTMSCKQARIVDRWAAKQAQEMVSTIEKQSQDAEFLVVSQKSSSAKEISYDSQHSVAQTEKLSESSNLGASSLVQIWEARLSRPEPKMDPAYSLKNNQNSAVRASRTSSGSIYIEILSSAVEEPLRQSDVIDSDANEEPMADCDSTAQSSRSSVHLCSSDVGENEKVRIADIIKRLTSETNDQEHGNNAGDPASRRHSYGSDQAELKALSHIIILPKIKGRQALNDLLFKMEKERQRELESLAERHSVSRFSQRGRIQSMLRLRCLQRGIEIQDQQRSQSIRSTIASDANRLHQVSTIMHLSERISAGVEPATSSTSDAATTQRSAEESKNNIDNNRNVSSIHVAEHGHHEDISTPEEQTSSSAGNQLPHISEIHEDAHEERSGTSDVTWQGTSSEDNNFDPEEVIESTSSLNNWDGNEMDDAETAYRHEFRETNYDWFADIARPRSYWEERRRAWYQEMLTTASDDNEIRQLLERRAVLNCLSSDFRKRMDRLMVSHVGRQTNSRDKKIYEESPERIGKLTLSFFRRHPSRAAGSSEEELDQDADEGDREEEEAEHAEGQLLQEADEEESSPSVNSPSPFRSWDYSHHHEVADDFAQVPTAPSQQLLPTQTSNQDRGIISFSNDKSMEMELIYNLRGHMEQLQLEMSELRRSMQTCMEVQAKLLNSLNQEAHPVQGISVNSLNIVTKRRSCCICYEMQVDSFLYRCGHMCTCLKCAHELQRKSGKCPICRAPILDVVKAYMDS